MNEIEIAFSILVLGVASGLFVAYLESRIDKDIWNHVKMLCMIAGGVSILFFIYFGYMVWYLIGMAFLSVALYESYKGNKHSLRDIARFGGTPHRFRRPIREERPQLEEWLS